jgi:hypothetical protein
LWLGPGKALGQRIDGKRGGQQISTAIMMTRPPPSRAGVMKKPSDSTKISTQPAKIPLRVSGI